MLFQKARFVGGKTPDLAEFGAHSLLTEAYSLSSGVGQLLVLTLPPAGIGRVGVVDDPFDRLGYTP